MLVRLWRPLCSLVAAIHAALYSTQSTLSGAPLPAPHSSTALRSFTSILPPASSLDLAHAPRSQSMELRNRTIGNADSSADHLDSHAYTTMAHQTAAMTPSSRKTPPKTFSFAHRTAAWLVHLYTATGLLVNMYSLLALFMKPNFSLFAKLNWLAILIDATDGTLARAVDIKNAAPNYDGAMLDNIIDFQTFSVLPALALIVFQLVPGFLLQYAMASVILLASAYQFCQTIAKTSDAFVGFPSYWNIVVFYVYYLRPSAPVTLALILICAVMSFVPVHFIYPTRTATNHLINHVGAYIWACLMLVPTFLPSSEYAKPALYVSFLYVIYYVLFSIQLDMRRRKAQD